jgi:KUP system potassium uptake protein
LLSVKITNDPYVDAELRCKYNEINDGFKQISIFYGYKESMDIPKELKTNQKLFKISFDNLSTSYFFSRQTIIPKFGYGMAIWREKIYTFLYRNASSVTTYFKIPINRVIELGTRIEI